MHKKLVVTALTVGLLAIAGVLSSVHAQGKPMTFSAFGDIPYSNSEYALIQKYAVDHNLYSPSAFIVHIGDMLTGSCDEKKYADMAQVMKGFKVPAYFVVGDNEYTDCDNPVQALAYWKKYFLNFEQNFCGAPVAEHQNIRSENFSFMWNGVLFVGINLVGASTIHDQNEWNTRMQDDANWVSQQFQAKVSQVRAAVIFAQTGNRTDVAPFTTQFRATAAAFAKPVLYIHGDLHSYKFDQPWSEKNIVRIQVPLGAAEPPLEVTVTMNSNPPSAFTVKRNPWGSTPLNMPPCVNAGPDQTIASTATATLHGGVTDDGDPGSNVTTMWSSVSGPGSVTFGNAPALTTTASFSLSGTYVLQLTASDGQLAKSDEVTIVVESAGPKLTIGDVSINEGNAGTSAAIFTVSLTEPNGQPAAVDYQIVNGTANNNDDYVANPTAGTLVFDGATTQTITVMINGDLVDEQQDETFFINLSNPTNATITDAQGLGTILNDDKPVPPAAPSDLSGGANSPTMITLTWTDHATNEDGFKIERKVGGIFNQIAVVGANVSAYADTGLSSNTAYIYRVRASNVAGHSVYSNEVSVSTPGVSTLSVHTNGSGTVGVDPTASIYLNGTVVTLTATPAADFRFGGWSGDLSGSDNPATLTMNQNKTVTANFIRVVTVTANTIGSGTVTLDPAASFYDAGTNITVTATPAAGFRFSGWGGDLSGSTNPAALSLNDNKIITATFTRVLTLMANTVGSGTVVVSPAGGSYDENTTVTLTATAAPGFQFNGWSGDHGGPNNPATLMMDTDKIVTANFAPLPIGIAHRETRIGGTSNSTTVTTLGSLAGVNGNFYLAAISMRPKVSVLAVSGLGLNWTLVKAKCGGRSTTAIEVWMAQGTPSGDGAVTATFATLPSTAVIAVSRYSGVAAVSPIGNLLAGNPTGLNAGGACTGGVDNSAYSFNLATTMNGAVIYGAAAIKGASHTPGQDYIERGEVLQAAGTNTSGVAVEDKIFETSGIFSVNGALSAAADWALVALEMKPQQYTVTLNKVGTGTIAFDTPSGVYRTGATAILTATPAAGFQFSGWSGDLTGATNPATLLMDANKNVTANFTALATPRTLTVNTAGSGSVATNPGHGFYDYGATVTLTATAAPGFQFNGWSGDHGGANNPATLMMDTDKIVTANFAPLPIGIAHRETRIGGTSNSTTVTTLGSLAGVNGNFYLAAISMRPKVSVLAVSGLGLNWTLVKAKCGGRSTTAIEVWMAQGTPSGDGAVTATFATLPSTAVIAVSRYSGVAAVSPIGNLLAGNPTGLNAGGACTGGVDNSAYSFNLATTMNGAVIYGAAAIKGASHTPGQDYIERGEVLQAAGTNTSGVAVEDKIFETSGIFSVNGALSAAADWALVALEMKPQQYTVTLNKVGTGTIAFDTPGGVYRTGATATLTATPAAGFQFSDWSGDLSGATNPATLLMDVNKNVTATFTAIPPPRILTVNMTGSGSVAVNPMHDFYDDGSTVTLTATPAAGFQFSGWNGDLSDMVNPSTLTMNADKNVTATFTVLPPTQHTLTVTQLGSGHVSLNPPGGVYTEGTVVTLTPLGDAGFQFSGWSGDLTGSLHPATLTMSANKTVNAIFSASNINLAKHRPITASSTYSGKPPEDAVDSTASTYWRSATTSKAVWLRVDLGASVMVGRITINWYKSYYAKDYEIQISNNDVNWQRVVSATGKSGVQTFNFAPQTTKYVRLYFTKSNSSSYRVAEFEAYLGVAATSKRRSEEMTEAATPDKYLLQQNYPNPFNPSTRISFDLPQAVRVTIKAYTINGAEVATIVDDYYVAGNHIVLFKPKNLPSGAYFYVMQAGDARQVRRFTFVK